MTAIFKIAWFSVTAANKNLYGKQDSDNEGYSAL